MLIYMELRDLDRDNRNYLKADLAFMKANMKHEIITTAKAIKNDRGAKAKFMMVLKSLSKSLKYGIKNIESIMNTLREIELFDYRIEERNSKVIVKLEISPYYLNIIKAVRQGGGYLYRRVGRDENQWLKMFSKEVERTYTKNYVVKDVTDNFKTKEEFFNS